jgi:DNA-binding CsgD family transcriptional regulator
MLDAKPREHVRRSGGRRPASSRPKNQTVLRSTLEHPVHAGCCVTVPFLRVVGDSSVPVLVVDGEGFVIYANPELDDLMGYPALAGKHITEVVDAAPNWVASEFSYLADNQLWSGNVLLRRFQGDNLRVTVNAFKSLVASSDAEYIAFLHGISGEGPAICRNPDTGTQYGLSVEEVALLELLSEGFSDREVAAIVGSPVAVVDLDVRRLLRKLDVASRSEAAVMALREGLLAA